MMSTENPPPTGGRVWITWERQRRSRSLSAALEATLFEICVDGGRLARYLLSASKTLRVLLQRRPDLVFVQSPSVVLAMLASLWCRVTRTPVIVDAHNAGVHPFEGRRPWANRVARFVFRNVNLTLVSNSALADYIRRSGGNAFALPDPLPVLADPPTRRTVRAKHQVLFVCSWAVDEPYMEVIEAARLLGSDVEIFITGNSRGRERKLGRALPSNVVLTGFLDSAAYDALLQDSDLVIDLTTREDCLVCGAYEAMAASRPLLLSDTRALRQYFDRGTLFTSNNAADIARQTRTALTQLPEMAREMQLLKESRKAEWEEQRLELEKLLEGFAESRSRAPLRSTPRSRRAKSTDADHTIRDV